MKLWRTGSGASQYALILASLADYRLRPVTLLHETLGAELVILAGTKPYDDTIRVLTAVDTSLTEIRNMYGPRQVLWQFLPWFTVLRAKAVIVDLNPRVITVWLVVLLRMLLGKRTVAWGHAWPLAGRSAKGEVLRRFLRSLTTALITYTHSQAAELRRVHPRKHVYAAPNALYRKDEIRFAPNACRFKIIYCGRMVPEKKPQLLLQAFEIVADRLSEARLTFIGSGPLLPDIRQAAALSAVTGRIDVLGHVNSYEDLAEQYDQAVVSVSPGYVGLNLTQSLSFGVPMIISRHESHSPEIEAADELRNCLFFDTDNVHDLASHLQRVWNDKEEWESRGPTIAARCAQDYSVERMVEGLIGGLTGIEAS